MKSLFTIIFVLGFIAFFVFVILMIRFIRKHNKLPLKYMLLTMSCFAITAIGIYGMLTLPSTPSPSGTGPAVVQESSETRPEPSQEASSQNGSANLHMTASEFKNRFNDAVGKYRLNGLNIITLDMKESSEQGTGTFEYVFNDQLRLTGVLNAEGKVREISLYGTEDTSKPTGGTQLVAIATLILTTNSEYTYLDSQKIMQDTGLLDRDINQPDFDGMTVRNGLQYRFSIQDQNHSTFEITAEK